MLMAENKITSFKDLIIWQKGIIIAKNVYLLTDNFPSQEWFGLTNQIRRAATSISLNIAEGYGRDSKGSYVQFLKIARGSLNELETALIIAQELNFADIEKVNFLFELILEENKMLTSLISKLNKNE